MFLPSKAQGIEKARQVNPTRIVPMAQEHIDDFRALSLNSRGHHIQRTYPRDKGHAANMAALAALTADEERHAQMIRDLELTGAVQFAAEQALLAGGGRIELTITRPSPA